MLDPNSLDIIQEEFGPGAVGGATGSSNHHFRRAPTHNPPSYSSLNHHRSDGGSTSGSRGHRVTGTSREKEKMRGKREKKFLREVQDELEEQRAEWKDEVDRLMSMSLNTPPGSSHGRRHNSSFSSDPGSPNSASSNSYVDTSSGTPMFKAFVDVSDFPARGIKVSVDKIQNKVVVEARRAGGDGTLTRTFTQKVQLPRYADDQMVRSRLAKDGVLMIEVPLMFYFPQEKKASKSFVNQVKTRPDGSKLLEILVNVGQEISPHDLKVKVNSDNELLILAEHAAPIGGATLTSRSKLIKRYILPPNADTRTIASRLGNDGRLVVTVPMTKDNTMLY